MKRYLTGFVTLAGTLFASATVLAHTGTLEPGSFMNGLVHPLHGLDHMLALFAIGLWTASPSLRRSVPTVLVFLCAMVAGVLLATRGIMLPAVEAGIAVSVLVAGLLLTSFARLGPVKNTVVIALFALFHGQAHALEMPGAAAPILYGFGLMCSSGLILLSAMRLGWFLQYSRAEWSLRGAGVLTGVTGGLWLLGV